MCFDLFFFDTEMCFLPLCRSSLFLVPPLYTRVVVRLVSLPSPIVTFLLSSRSVVVVDAGSRHKPHQKYHREDQGDGERKNKVRSFVTSRTSANQSKVSLLFSFHPLSLKSDYHVMGLVCRTAPSRSTICEKQKDRFSPITASGLRDSQPPVSRIKQVMPAHRPVMSRKGLAQRKLSCSKAA